VVRGYGSEELKDVIIFGVDPGVSGAIILFNGDCVECLTLKDATEKDISQTFANAPQGLVVIEHVSSSPQQGVVSAFNFGMSYGGLRMAAIAAGHRIESVLPRRWQSAIQVRKIGGGFGKNDTDKKRAIKAKAQELFPGLKITNATAAALLIAEYGRRVYLKEIAR
jgi:hypothetical protein